MTDASSLRHSAMSCPSPGKLYSASLILPVRSRLVDLKAVDQQMPSLQGAACDWGIVDGGRIRTEPREGPGMDASVPRREKNYR